MQRKDWALVVVLLAFGTLMAGAVASGVEVVRAALAEPTPSCADACACANATASR